MITTEKAIELIKDKVELLSQDEKTLEQILSILGINEIVIR